MTDLLIIGATDPSGVTSDLFIKAGRFADPSTATSKAQRIDADGLTVLPGLIDLHAHLREPGAEEAETIASAARAAARGGFSIIHGYADTDPTVDTAVAAQAVARIASEAAVRVRPVGAISRGRRGGELAELGLMHSHAGITMFSDCPTSLANADLLRRALEYVSSFGGVISQHAQDPHLAGPSACCHEGELSGRLGLPGWPAAAESVVVSRDVQVAELTGGRLHIAHLSTAESVEVVRWAKKRGVAVTAEVAAHHLYFSTAEVATFDPAFKVNPPLRTDEHIEALRAGVADGTIDAITSDHSPHEPQDADHAFVDAQAGMLGLEQTLAVAMETMLDRMEWPTLVQRLSAAPAQIAGLPVPSLAVGAAADLVLIDPTARATVDKDQSASRARNNPYHQRELPDPVRLTVVDGAVAYAR